MAEEDKTKETNPMEKDYLEEIEKLKANTVDKEQFEKLKEENKKLLKSIVDGKLVHEEEPQEEKVDVNQLRRDLFSEEGKLNNLEYWEAALKLRQAEIDAGKRDPFLPYGHHVSPDVNDVSRVENLVNVVKECIDYAKGDSIAFTNELNRRTNEAMPTVQARRR